MTLLSEPLMISAHIEPTATKVATSALRSEWIKLRTVRSTIWALLVTVGLTVGLGALLCAARVSRWDRAGRGERLNFDAAGFSLNGIFLAQLAVVVLGSLVMSSEYATGQIRATLGATPQRLMVLGSKVAVFAAVIFVTTGVAAFAAFEIGQSILSAKHADVALGDPGVLRAVLLAPVYLALIGSMAVAVATILRRTAGAITAMVGLLLVAPIIVSFLPDPWNTNIGKFLPGEAGSAMFHVVKRTDSLAPLPATLLVLAYLVVVLVAAGLAISRRDA